MKKENLLGLVFDRLTVVDNATSCKRGQARWLCACSCGQTVVVSAFALKSGNTSSCGCKRKEITSQRSRVLNKTHGATVAGRNTPEWNAWCQMRSRCRNSKHRQFKHYGGRGITVDPAWDSFEQFMFDMGKRPGDGYSLDRIDNALGYCQSNCRWATSSQQNNNLRTNHLIEINGRKQTVSQWSRELGLSRKTVVRRFGIKPAE